MGTAVTRRKILSEELEMRNDALALIVTRTQEALQAAISAQHRAEEVLRKTRAHLAEMAERQKRRSLQTEKMVALGILVSGIAHEINNPNNYILLNSRLISSVWNDAKVVLDERYEKTGEFSIAGMPYSQGHEKIGQLVDGIAEGSLRIQKIVQGLKGFSREDTGSLDQTVDVNAVIEMGLVIMNSFIERHTDFFSVKYGQDMPSVQGNVQQLEQVIINLVSNACEALPCRERGISISTHFVREANNITIRIQDEGGGIAPEHLDCIFDPFFTTKRSAGGVGLGLSTSLTIVRNHGGELKYVSQPGKGTTATIVLPIG